MNVYPNKSQNYSRGIRLFTTSIVAIVVQLYTPLVIPALVASFVTVLAVGRKSTTRMGKVGASVVVLGNNAVGASVLVGVVGGTLVGALLVAATNDTTVGVAVGTSLVGEMDGVCVVARNVGV